MQRAIFDDIVGRFVAFPGADVDRRQRREVQPVAGEWVHNVSGDSKRFAWGGVGVDLSVAVSRVSRHCGASRGSGNPRFLPFPRLSPTGRGASRWAFVAFVPRLGEWESIFQQGLEVREGKQVSGFIVVYCGRMPHQYPTGHKKSLTISRKALIILVGRPRLERGTIALKVRCSTD